MYLSKNLSLDLVNNGFKREFHTDISDEKLPYDFYSFEGSEWILGGRILPQGSLLAPEDVHLKGIWLISYYDMLSWLVSNDIKHEITYSGLAYKLTAILDDGRSLKAKGGTLEVALYKVILQILKEYGPNPSGKTVEVLEAEYIGTEEL